MVQNIQKFPRQMSLWAKILLCLALLHLSCEQYIQLSVPETAPQMVLFGTMMADKPLSVLVYSTLPVLGEIPDTSLVSHADVWCFQSEVDSFPLVFHPNGTYQSDRILMAGQRYALRITHPNYPTLLTESVLLPPVDSFSWVYPDGQAAAWVDSAHSVLMISLPDSPASNVMYLRLSAVVEEDTVPLRVNLVPPGADACQTFGKSIYLDLACFSSSPIRLAVPAIYRGFGPPVTINHVIVEAGFTRRSEMEFYRAAYQEDGLELGLSAPLPLPGSIQNGLGYWSFEAGQSWTIFP